MKVSIDGLRKQLHIDLVDLKEKLERVIAGKNFDKDDLAESFNCVLQHSNFLNCVYSDKEDDFNDLSRLHISELDSSLFD